MDARSVYRVQLLLLAIYFAAAGMLWSVLPERVPIHFDLAGQPNAWARTSVMSWFALPLLAAATTLFLYGLGRASIRAPELWNIPEKDRFLALSPEARAPIIAYLERALAWSAVLVTFTFISIHVGMYQTAIGRSAGLSWGSILFICAPVGIVLLVALSIAGTAGEQVQQACRESAATGESS